MVGARHGGGHAGRDPLSTAPRGSGVAIRRRAPASPGEWPEGVPPLLRRIYAARGALSIDDARPRLAHLLPPEGLLGLEDATALLADAIAHDRHIVVVGDFDCERRTQINPLFHS